MTSNQRPEPYVRSSVPKPPFLVAATGLVVVVVVVVLTATFIIDEQQRTSARSQKVWQASATTPLRAPSVTSVSVITLLCACIGAIIGYVIIITYCAVFPEYTGNLGETESKYTNLKPKPGLFQDDITPLYVSRGSKNQSIYFSEAEKTVGVPFLDHHLLECDSAGREWTNIDHDITVRIPEGAVAEGEKIHFEVGVALYGPFIYPDNTQPISPVLWLCLLEENVKLKKPFQVVIPHYLTGLSKARVQYHQVRFAKASHNNFHVVNDQITYKFQNSETEPLLASTRYKSYGILVAKHCCFYCLLANKTHDLAKDSGYCLVQVEYRSSPLRYDIHFSAIYFLDTCLKSLDEQFPREEGYRITCYHFKFTDDKAELHIRVGPLNKSQRDQCVIASAPEKLKIRAEDIYFWTSRLDVMRLRHQRGTYPPRVKVTVTLRHPDYLLKLPFKFTGCSSDHPLDMELTFPLDFPSSSPTSSTSSVSPMDTQSHTITCEKPKLSKALKYLLPVATEWGTIGTFLEIESGVLDQIAADATDSRTRLRLMLTEWLKQVTPQTWKQLAEAVEDSGNQDIATRIKNCCIDAIPS